MSNVIGSKHPTLKVVKHRPGVMWAWISAGIFLAVITAVAAYYRGYHVGKDVKENALYRERIKRLETAVSSAEKDKQDLQQQLANISLGAEVDRQASEAIRQEVISYKKELAELKEVNAFYRGLMAPTKNKHGLTFGDVEFFETEKNGVVAFTILVKQLATSHNVLKGALKFHVVGERNGVEEKLSLHEISPDIELPDIKLRFKYFQTIQGTLTLPKDFQALRAELVAESTGKNAVTIEKQVGWLVQKQR